MKLKLVLENIHKNYDGKPVLKDISFSFDFDCIHLLMGPNGSGKSTLLRICALLEDPEEGKVNYFSGNNIVTKDVRLRRRISLVLPKVGIFNTTVFNNIAYGLKVRGFQRKDINRRVSEALEFVGLYHKRNLNALRLSSGEMQRLGIARAIVIEILFLDEPTASLDPHSTAMIEEIIKEIRKSRGPTIIMVTHNIFQAQRLADRVLFMYDAKIVDYGTKKEFFENPRDERAYKFITGQMVY
ncbi:MAG: phosphate ABC transporter ATP-binding protein [Nitrospirota bacterium]